MILTNEVIWFYGINQKLFHEIRDVTFVEGLHSDYQKYLSNHSLMTLGDLKAVVPSDETHFFVYERNPQSKVLFS